MPDPTPKRDQVKPEKPADKVDELPPPPIADKDAQSVKGGKHIGNIKY